MDCGVEGEDGCPTPCNFVEPEATPPKSCPPPSTHFMNLYNHSLPPLRIVPNAGGHFNSWKTGIFDCCGDRSTCFLTAMAPCVAFGRIARFADDASNLDCVIKGGLYCAMLLVGFHCCYSCGYREKLRKKLKLPGNRNSDLLVHCLCECCALCQEYQQVKVASEGGESMKSMTLSPPLKKKMIR